MLVLGKLFKVIRENLDVVLNSASLMGTTVITAGLGFVYWWAAARFFTEASYGFANAAVPAMMLLGSIGIFGLGPMLIGELPRTENKGAFIMTGLLVSAATSTLLGLGFALGAPFLSPELAPLAASPVDVLLFASGVTLTGMTWVLDIAVIGLMRGELQLIRNTFFAASKLVFLVLVGLLIKERSAMLIYATWMAGNLFSVGALAVVMVLRGQRVLFKPNLKYMRGLGGKTVGHMALDFTLQAPSYLMPILVTAILSATQNAYFSVPVMLEGFLSVLTVHITTVLYAVGVKGDDELIQKMPLTLAATAAISVAGIVGVFIFAEPALAIFGPEYAAQGQWVLRILTITLLPQSIKNHYVTIRRARGEMMQTAVVMTAIGIFETTVAVIGMLVGGLVGLTVFWLGATIVSAIFTAPRVYRTLRSSHGAAKTPSPSIQGSPEPAVFAETPAD